MRSSRCENQHKAPAQHALPADRFAALRGAAEARAVSPQNDQQSAKKEQK